MFSHARLKHLQRRKQELLTAAGVQRRLLVIEYGAVQQRLEWLDGAVAIARRFGPWVGLAGPLLRLWSACREKRERSWLQRLVSALPVAIRFASAAQQFNKREPSR